MLATTAPSFVEPTNLPPTIGNAGQVAGVAKGDFNADGKLDLAVTYNASQYDGTSARVAFLAGNGDGTFQAPVNLPIPASQGTVANIDGILAKDFERNGKLDLVVAEPDLKTLLYYHGNGDGTFAPPAILPAGARVDSIQTADLNGDGTLDLVGLDRADNSVTVSLGRGDGTFAAPTLYSGVGSTVTDMALGDVDAKNGPDIVLASQGDQKINVLLNDGAGNFGPVVTTSLRQAGVVPRTVVAADFLGIGTTQVVIGVDQSPPDAADAYYGGPALALLRPNGDGTFQVPTTSAGYTPEDEYASHYYSENVAPDLNGDGRPDLLFGHTSGANLVTVGLNRGDGTFAVSRYVASPGPGPTTPPGPYNNKETLDPGVVLAGDFHGTGVPDIVAGAFNDNNRAGGLSLLPAVRYTPGTYLSPRTFGTLSEGDHPTGGLGTSGPDQLLGRFGPNNTQALITVGTHTIYLSVVNADGTIGVPKPILGNINYGNRGDLTEADFNNDGRPDFAFIVNGVVGIVLNNGDGTFTLSTTVSSSSQGFSAASVAINDFNGDGKPDVAILSSTFGFNASNQVDVYLNNGAGGFNRSATLSLGSIPGYYGFGIAAGDFGGDGKVDIVADYAATLNNRDIALFRGDGNGGFSAPTVIASPGNNGEPTELIAADLRHVGRLDLVGNAYGSVQVYLGNGDGTFQAGALYAAGEPFDLRVADLNGDGYPDIAAAGQAGLYVLAGNGDGTFNAAQQFAVGQGSLLSVNVGDVNGDGKPDIVTERSENAGDVTTVLLASSTLTVNSLTPTTTGFTAAFDLPFNLGSLNLYDTATAGLGPADVTLVGASTGPVAGSLIVAPGNRAFTFVKTGGVLASDTYTLTLRSAANGFTDASGVPLDGNGDGTTGDNYVNTFVVAPSSARVIGVPDFARGPGQAVNVPATGSGLPLTIGDGTGVTSISLSLAYNPALLTINGANLGPAAPAGSSVTIDTSTPGTALLIFTSPTALPSGPGTFVTLTASVPSSAPYASKEVLALGNISLDGGSIAGTDDDGVHVVAYFGDTTGNGGYSSLDASLVKRVVANVDTGFAAYPLLDPTILADIAGHGSLSSLDATYINQFVANLPQPRIPALPGGTITRGGPDPLIWLPRTLGATPGSTLAVPVLFRQTNGSAIGLDSADLAIEFDPNIFEVTGIRLGDLPSGFTLTETYDNATGEIIASERSTSGPIVLAPGTQGTLLWVDFLVRPGANLGAARINLLGEGRVGSAVVYTSLNDGNLTLVPAPTDSDLDPTDGVVTVAAPAAMQPTIASVAGAGVASPDSAASPVVLGSTIQSAGPAAAVDRAIESTHGSGVPASGRGLLGDLFLPDPVESSPATLIPWAGADPSLDFAALDGPLGPAAHRKTKDGRAILAPTSPGGPVAWGADHGRS